MTTERQTEIIGLARMISFESQLLEEQLYKSAPATESSVKILRKKIAELTRLVQATE